jgi:hypothetical protein
MDLENIILREVSTFRKKKFTFSLICGRLIQYKYTHHQIYIKIYTEHVSKSETGRGDRGRRKSDRVNNNEIHHICVGTRHNKTH